MTLREWRKSKGLTLQQLAERVDVSVSQLAKIEKRKSRPSPPAADRIAAATGGEISAAELLGLSSAAHWKGMQEDTVGFSFGQSGQPDELRKEAAAYSLNVEAIARKAVEDAVKQARIRDWVDENRRAFAAHSLDIEEKGLWSDGLRLF